MKNKTSLNNVYEHIQNAFIYICKAEENLAGDATFCDKKVWHKEYANIEKAQNLLNEILENLEFYQKEEQK